jgi:hypothetical protein
MTTDSLALDRFLNEQHEADARLAFNTACFDDTYYIIDLPGLESPSPPAFDWKACLGGVGFVLVMGASACVALWLVTVVVAILMRWN